MRGLTFDQLLLDAFDQLSPFYVSEHNSEIASSALAKISAEYWGIKGQLHLDVNSMRGTKQQRALPPQLTPQALARFLGEARCCWVLEDFHKVDEDQKAPVSQMMKIFMDVADEYRELKMIAIGAVDTARQVVQFDSEMRHRVAEIHVPLMVDSEIGEIIAKGEGHLNIRIDDGIKGAIVHYSNGVAAVCHHLCLNACVAGGIEEASTTLIRLGESHMTAGLKQYLEEVSDTLKYAFDKAFKRRRAGKFDNCRLILHALSVCQQDGATHAEILSAIGNPNYPSGNLTQYLRELQREERGCIIRYNDAAGTFAFADPIYRAFCLAYFTQHPVPVTSKGWQRTETIPPSIDDILNSLVISGESGGLFTRLLQKVAVQRSVTEPIPPSARLPKRHL